jgi:hypothetical protein
VNYSQTGQAGVHYATLSTGGSLTATAAADTPDTGIVAVGSTGATGTTFLKVDLLAQLEDVVVKSIEIERSMSSNADFASISLWDGSTQLGGNQDLVNSSTTFNFPSGSYWTIPAGTTKTLTVKGNLAGIESKYSVGVSSGDTPKLCLAADAVGNLKFTAEGASSGNTVNASSTAPATDLCGNYQILHKTKPALASATLPSTVYGAGTKTLYRWTVTADSNGDIGWKKVVFDVSGSVSISSTQSLTIGMGTTADSYTNHAIYMGTGSDYLADKAAVTTLKVYNVGTNNEITAANTPYVYHGGAAGGAKVIFIANSEQQIAAGQTKTYELQGTLGYAGYSGDQIQTNIAAISTGTSTGAYATIAGGAGETATSTAQSFVWSDRSGDGNLGTHSAATADWTQDYKVSGIPTTALVLTKN